MQPSDHTSPTPLSKYGKPYPEYIAFNDQKGDVIWGKLSPEKDPPEIVSYNPATGLYSVDVIPSDRGSELFGFYDAQKRNLEALAKTLENNGQKGISLFDLGFDPQSKFDLDSPINSAAESIDGLMSVLQSGISTKLMMLSNGVKNLSLQSLEKLSKCLDSVETNLQNLSKPLAQQLTEKQSNLLEEVIPLGISPADLLISGASGEPASLPTRPFINPAGDTLGGYFTVSKGKPNLPQGSQAQAIPGQPAGQSSIQGPQGPFMGPQIGVNLPGFPAGNFVPQIPAGNFGQINPNFPDPFPNGIPANFVDLSGLQIPDGKCLTVYSVTKRRWQVVTNKNGPNPIGPDARGALPPNFTDCPPNLGIVNDGMAGIVGNQAQVIFPPGMPGQNNQQQNAAQNPPQNPGQIPEGKGGVGPAGKGAALPGDGPAPANPSPAGLPDCSALSGPDNAIVPDAGVNCVEKTPPEKAEIPNSAIQGGVSVPSSGSNYGQKPGPENLWKKPGDIKVKTDDLCGGLYKLVTSEAVLDQDFYWKIFGLDTLKKNYTEKSQLPGVGDFFKGIGGQIVGMILQDLTELIEAVISTATQGDCGDSKVTGVIALKSIYGLLNRWLGFSSTTIENNLAQSENAICPTNKPSLPSAISAFLSGKIDRDTFECWVKMDGTSVPIADKLLATSKQKLSPLEIVTLYKRGELSESQYAERIKELGYFENNTKEEFKKLFRQLPGMSDLIRMMVRDAGDNALVAKFGMDEEFEQKWSQNLARFGEMQGVDEEIAKLYWRAHWSIPAPGQLYEMLHRLRKNPKYGGEAAFTETVRQALIQQDILPYWIDAFMEISYKPLTRVDTRRMYDLGVLDRDGVVKSYQDQGYDDDNSERLADYAENNRMISLMKKSYLKAWAMGELSDEDLDKYFEIDKVPEIWRDNMKRAGELEASKTLRKACVTQIRKRFLQGELDQDEAKDELGKFGVALPRAIRITDNWGCLRAAKSKQISAGQVCRMYHEGILRIDQVQDRLVNLGYSPQDALLLIGQCQFSLDEKTRKSAENKAKSDQKEFEKAKRAGEKAAKEADKNAAALARKAEIMRKARERRNNLLVGAAEELAKRTGSSVVLTLPVVQQTQKELQQRQAISIDDSIKKVVIASEDWNPEIDSDLLVKSMGVILPLAPVLNPSQESAME